MLVVLPKTNVACPHKWAVIVVIMSSYTKLVTEFSVDVQPLS